MDKQLKSIAYRRRELSEKEIEAIKRDRKKLKPWDVAYKHDITFSRVNEICEGIVCHVKKHNFSEEIKTEMRADKKTMTYAQLVSKYNVTRSILVDICKSETVITKHATPVESNTFQHDGKDWPCFQY